MTYTLSLHAVSVYPNSIIVTINTPLTLVRFLSMLHTRDHSVIPSAN